MMFFVYHLQTYSPKNRAWKKVIDYVEKYKDVLIKDELSLDALKHEIGDVVNRINAEHPKMKRMQYTASLIDNDRTIRSCHKWRMPGHGILSRYLQGTFRLSVQ